MHSGEADKPESLKQRALEEIRAFWLIALYLWMFLGAFAAYRALILAESGVLYMRFGMAMDRATKGGTVGEEDFWYPDVRAGYEGVKYVNKCVESADNGAVWVEY